MKKYLSILFVLLATLIMVGCSSNNDTSKNGKSGSDSDSVVVWYYWEAKAHQDALNKMVDKYNDSQDKVKVEAKYIPFADFKKQLSIGASAAELPDIVLQDNPDFAAYANMGIYADITDQVKEWDFFDQYYEGPLSSCALDDRYYGVPFGSNNIGLYYNVEMLEKAGVNPPTTWDELKEASKKLTNGTTHGFAFSALQNEEGTFNFMPWLWSSGVDYESINSPEGVKAVEFISDLVKDGSMPKEAINWTQGDVNSQFMSGNLAMMVNGPWQIPTIETEAADLKWDVTYIPKNKEFTSDLGGENFGIINGEKVAESLDFVKFMSDNTLDYINDFGFIASRKDIADIQFEGDSQNPAYGKFAEMLDITKARGPHPQWPEISDAISLAFNEAITESASAEEAVKKAEATIEAILNQ